MDELQQYRAEIDRIDRQMVELFRQRMAVTAQVGQYKLERGIPVLDAVRERQVLQDKAQLVEGDLRPGVTTLFQTMMSISRRQQRDLTRERADNPGVPRFVQALSRMREPIQHPRVVFQGEPGAYSEQACINFFGEGVQATGLPQFEDTFLALKEGRADYAVLPIENSSTGAIRQIYDLLSEYDFFLVGETTVKVDHCLMALPGATLDTITHVYSHEQGLFQSEKFLNAHPHWKQVPQADTAGSAQMVAQSGDLTKAALCSARAAQIYGLNILEVRRENGKQHRFLKTVTQKLAEPHLTLHTDDLLYVKGTVEQIRAWAKDCGLELVDGHTTEEAGNAGQSLDFYDIGIAEIVLMPTSRIINRTIKEAGLRDKFDVNVLGIRRKKDYLLQGLGDTRILSGDVLLVQGTWANISRLSREDENWVVLGQPLEEAAKVTLDYKAPLAAAIMVFMVAMMVFDFIPVAPVTAVLIAGLLMVLTGCFRNVEAAYKTINWESIVLIAAMLPMSLALEKTGASQFISNSLVSGLGQFGPIALMAGIYFTTSLMTLFISNTATAVLLAPIALQSAQQIGVSPVPFLFAVTVAASMCFASPFSTPPNALVMHAGQYRFMDYVKVGLPLQLIMGIVMVFALPLLFPF